MRCPAAQAPSNAVEAVHEGRHSRRIRTGRDHARARLSRGRPRRRRPEPPSRAAAVARRGLGWRDPRHLATRDRRLRCRDQPDRPQRQLPLHAPRIARQILQSRVCRRASSDRRSRRRPAPPRVWLQASTATIYAHRLRRPNDEHSRHSRRRRTGRTRLLAIQHRRRARLGARIRRGPIRTARGRSRCGRR